MSLTQYYTATTLDGFIADPDNSLAWLFVQKSDPEAPLGYDEFIAGVGAMVEEIARSEDFAVARYSVVR